MATSPAQSALHPVYVRLLGVLLARRGIDTQALLSAAQITRHELQKDTLLPYAPIERLILGAIEASACPGWAWNSVLPPRFTPTDWSATPP